MDTAVEFDLSVFKDRLVERRVRIGASKEHQIDVRKASVIIIIILTLPSSLSAMTQNPSAKEVSK
jgi:hypothetical protein